MLFVKEYIEARGGIEELTVEEKTVLAVLVEGEVVFTPPKNGVSVWGRSDDMVRFGGNIKAAKTKVKGTSKTVGTYKGLTDYEEIPAKKVSFSITDKTNTVVVVVSSGWDGSGWKLNVRSNKNNVPVKKIKKPSTEILTIDIGPAEITRLT